MATHTYMDVRRDNRKKTRDSKIQKFVNHSQWRGAHNYYHARIPPTVYVHTGHTYLRVHYMQTDLKSRTAAAVVGRYNIVTESNAQGCSHRVYYIYAVYSQDIIIKLRVYCVYSQTITKDKTLVTQIMPRS
jgi:hypothetical protein